ncbi:unnamed protein product [Mytilus coruscus]|uniref:Integrase zinc-binding domain-containing protein n=1 Tax=Mytilus coruscus TaxID=42192 RepID=A0A6J8ETC8_MYTCO|nr:unnamed protein product [Mytilus coruscus]
MNLQYYLFGRQPTPSVSKHARRILLDTPDYILIHGVLYQNRKAKSERNKSKSAYQLAVPHKMIDIMLFMVHDLPLGGHSGNQNTLDRLRDSLYFPRMGKIVKDYVASCHHCQSRTVTNLKTKTKIVPYRTPSELFLVWDRISSLSHGTTEAELSQSDIFSASQGNDNSDELHPQQSNDIRLSSRKIRFPARYHDSDFTYLDSVASETDNGDVFKSDVFWRKGKSGRISISNAKKNSSEGVTPLETQQSENFTDNEINTDSPSESIVPITMAESVHQQRSSVSNGENENGGTDRNKTAESQNIAQCFAGLEETFKLLINRDNTHDKSREFNLQQWYDHAGIGNRSETYTSIRRNYQGQGNTENASFISETQIGIFSCGVRSDEYSNVDIISPSIQKQIIDVRKEFSPINQTDPLFITIDKKPLERQYFLTCITKVLDICGLNSSYYNGHSFRIGAATSAGKAKIKDHLIKTLGRWSSDSYIRYIRVTPASIKSAQNRLGRI